LAAACSLLLLDVAAAAPDLLLHIRDYALTDLRMGVRQKQFRIVSEAAAMDLINGTVAQAMRSVVYFATFCTGPTLSNSCASSAPCSRRIFFSLANRRAVSVISPVVT
jgi:hypothetical protein